MKKLLLLALVAMLGLPWQAPANTCTESGDLTATGQTVTLNRCPGAGAGAVQLTGTWSGTLQVQGSLDNSNWFSLPIYGVSGNFNPGTVLGSMSGPGIYSVALGGIHWARVRAYSMSSGTCTAALVSDQGQPMIQQIQGGPSGVLVQTAPTLTTTPTATTTPTMTPTPTASPTPTATVTPGP